jgi:hypothetical protein
MLYEVTMLDHDYLGDTRCRKISRDQSAALILSTKTRTDIHVASKAISSSQCLAHSLLASLINSMRINLHDFYRIDFETFGNTNSSRTNISHAANFLLLFNYAGSTC